MFSKLNLILFICLHISQADNKNGNPVITTPYGKIVGLHSKSYSGRTYSEFLSVPFAQPPVGELRFKEPQPLKKWEGTWVANFTIECAQWRHTLDVGEYYGQEDCLYSNIFVPRRNPSKQDKLLDVIIDIHGGGLNFGSNIEYTGPKHLMDKEIILVAINYRLGPLGFLSTEDEVVPGNNGMKDQVAAIKWVKENIQYFGGNPDSITLTGLSAGGASVHLHYMSPLSAGLFKGGISLSGTALCPWPMQENANQQTRTLAKALGCEQESSLDLINCLRQRSVVHICESTRVLRPWLYNPFTVFGVVVEKHGKNPFLPEHPYELLAKGKIRDLPWITTVVSHEGLYPVAEFIAHDEHLMKLEKDWIDLAPLILHFDHTIAPELKSTVAKKIKKYYFKDKPISSETKEEVINVASDRLFNVDAEKAARLQAKANKSPTYFYYFSYESEVVHSFVEIQKIDFEKRPGVCHGDDLAFVFNCITIPIKKLSDKDLRMREILLNIWTSFARTGKPHISAVEWTPVSNNPNHLFNYLHIKSPDNLEMIQSEYLGNRPFWDSLKFNENEQLFPGINKDEL